RPSDELLGRPGDLLPALARELGEPVLLHISLRVEAELPLDADLDPEALTIEAVLVTLIEAAKRLVALEDVLQRATPGRVHAQRLVGGDWAVDKTPYRAAAVALSQLFEDAAILPPRKDLFLECGMVGNGWKLPEHAGSQCSARDSPTFQESVPLPYGLGMISRMCPFGSSQYTPRPPSLVLNSPGRRLNGSAQYGRPRSLIRPKMWSKADSSTRNA